MAYADMIKAKLGRVITLVPPKVSSIAEFIICGEQPGQQEVVMKEPFYGPSGKMLKGILTHAGIPTAACTFTNVLKDYDSPLEDYIEAPKTRNASVAWKGRANDYISILREEVSSSPAKIIIAVGNVALAALTGRWGITKWRGSILPCMFDESKWVIPIIHPASVLRGQSENRILIVSDLKKAKAFYDSGMKLNERRIITGPSFSEAMSYLNKCYDAGMSGKRVAYDIEIKNLEVSCISFAIDYFEGISIPFMWSKGDYFSPPQEAEIWKAIGHMLANKSIRKVGQNLGFDSHFLLRRYGIRTDTIDDSMIAFHTLLPQLPKGLDMITSLFTDQPYYKDEGKEWFKHGGAYETLWHYNGLDSCVCLEGLEKIIAELLSQGNLEAYDRQLSILQPCVYMMERGIKIDLPQAMAERSRMEGEAASLRSRLAELAPNLNPQSPVQMKKYFYSDLGLKSFKNTKGAESVDELALKRISRTNGKGSEEARLIMGIRKIEKLSSTYLSEKKYDSDGRVRCSYNPCGTTYSRLSSSSSLFGTGMNMQNWPHSMLRFLKIDDGYVGYSIDLSQAENRIVAYVGKIEKMIDAFETGKDVHRLTAALIFGKPPEEISAEPGSCPLGTGIYSERDWGKKANHGLNYGLGYKNFALRYEMPETEGKRIYNGYHGAYPEVQQNFHGYVKKCLRENRTVPNLMGRKTMFVTDLDDATFKEAYSCIPQGTVGDIINQQGMALIYYDRRFREVELIQQVHDSLTFQIPLSLSWEEHAYLVDTLKSSLEIELTTHYGRKFVIPADVCVSLSLQKESGIELKAKNWPSLDSLPKCLADTYNQLLSRNAA